jgi:hypothetical protein
MKVIFIFSKFGERPLKKYTDFVKSDEKVNQFFVNTKRVDKREQKAPPEHHPKNANDKNKFDNIRFVLPIPSLNRIWLSKNAG